jgi:signal transduction histidine kinase
LINNSLKFSKTDQSPVITITSSATSQDGLNFEKIVVADNGIGFDPEHNTTIFRTFTRLNSKDRYDGTGLGLSLAKKIVERHHGVIEAEGCKDRGAVFTILLPAKQPVK